MRTGEETQLLVNAKHIPLYYTPLGVILTTLS